MTLTDSIICAEKESFRLERKFLLKWKIHDFVCNNMKAGEALPSTKFEFSYDGDTKLNGHLYIFGDDCFRRKCVLDLKSSSLDNWRVCVELLFGDDISKNRGVVLYQAFNNTSWNLFSAETRCILSKYMRNNVIKLTCIITYVIYTEDKSLVAATVNDYDTAELFETKVNSDVTFVVAGNELPAHKSILAKRSQVFAALFEEDESNKITLSDIDMDVLRELLRFIYTGKEVKVTKDLLAASDKYHLPDLKTICEKELSYEVSNETVTKTLVMADNLQDSKIKGALN